MYPMNALEDKEGCFCLNFPFTLSLQISHNFGYQFV